MREVAAKTPQPPTTKKSETDLGVSFKPIFAVSQTLIHRPLSSYTWDSTCTTVGGGCTTGTAETPGARARAAPPPSTGASLRPPARWRRNKYAACGRLGPAGPPLPVVGPLPFGLLQGLVHGLLALAPALGAVPLALGLVAQPHAGEVEPLDGALVVVAANHLPVGDLVAQTVRGLVRVDGQVRGGRLPLRFGLGALLLLGGLGLLLLGRARGDVIVVVIIRGVLPVLVVALPPGPLVVGLLRLGDRLVFGLVLAGFAVARGVSGLLVGLQQLHVAVHLPGPVLHQLHHLTHKLDLLVAQLLAADQRPLDAVQCSPLLGAVRLPLEPLVVLVQFLQDLCQGENKRETPPNTVSNP